MNVETISTRTLQAIVADLRAAVKREGSQRAFATKAGLSNSLVSLILAGKREPNEMIANSVGYFRTVTYTKSGNTGHAG